MCLKLQNTKNSGIYKIANNSVIRTTRELNCIESKVNAVLNKHNYYKSHKGFIFIKEEEYFFEQRKRKVPKEKEIPILNTLI